MGGLDFLKLMIPLMAGDEKSNYFKKASQLFNEHRGEDMSKIKLIIIGGVAGGATAAARARRMDEGSEIILLERGEYISFANCGLPYYVGEVIKKRQDLLVTTPEAFRKRYHIDIRINCEVIAIDRKRKQVSVRNHKETYWETYDKIILAPGAEPLKPPLEGINLEGIYNLRNIPDTDKIKKHVDRQKPESAVIVGGGFIGLEMVENLVQRGVRTTIVEMADQVMLPLDGEMAQQVQTHLESKGVVCKLGKGVKGFRKEGDRLVVSIDKGQDIECDLVILSIGIRPENRLAKEAGLEVGKTGGIKVNAAMQTSDPDIYAVGDAVEVREFIAGFPLISALAGPANKQGRIAADNALGRKTVFRGTMRTSIVKVFDLAVASTGLSEKTLRSYGLPYQVSYTCSGSHASYYPGAETITIKLIFAPGNGRVLGAQIIGKEGVDKRIDVLATSIHGGMTVFDLEELELAYAPPYSSAKDPVNIAGFVASNLIKGDVENVYPQDLGIPDLKEHILLDLRSKAEIKQSGTIDGAVHIPVDDLRDQLKHLDKGKTYTIYCAVGQRAYLGYRILTQNGFRAKNLSGGYETYKAFHLKKQRTFSDRGEKS
jgi:NADPH-dependent 2,4-dienoyl-CoA reductase/sulfur reductase-like enzyme/rhodanese-related sulfurtransferase